MLVLFETSAGYALFRISDENKLSSAEDIAKIFQSPEKAQKFVKLHAFKKFKDTSDAVKSLSEFLEGSMPKDLKTFLKKNIISKEIQENLLCYDKKVAKAIKNSLDIETTHGAELLEVFRGIRSQISNLISGVTEQDFKNISVGLSHNFYRYKLKFSVDKVDVMVIQAVGLLDDLDKELNNYAMRLREWYGWHFPECGKIVTDNVTFAKVVKFIGMRTNTKDLDLSELVPEDIEKMVKEAAEISMGSEISDDDEFNIKELCDQIISLSEYRQSLTEYLKARMMAIAPNLTVMVGELVAARLISHAGSLINLAKQPASTIQIFGAEKALFRALRTKHDTPKYGLIYHASLVGSANPKLKGKISRSLASKCALCVRVDALRDSNDGSVGTVNKNKLEMRIKALERGVGGASLKLEKTPKTIEKYNPGKFQTNGTFKTESEVQLTKKKKRTEDSDDEEVVEVKKSKKKAKAVVESDSD